MFKEWVEFREAQGVNLGFYTKNAKAEIAEDAEAAYNAIVKMSTEPTRTMRRGPLSQQGPPPFSYLHYAADYLTNPTNRQEIIQGAMRKIISKAKIGDKRNAGRTIAKNYIMGVLQKDPISRKTVEFGRSLGYSPTMTLTPQTIGNTSQYFSSPPMQPDTTQYVGTGIYRPAGTKKLRTGLPQ